MAELTTQTINSNTQVYGYDATWASLMDFMDKPQVWKEIFQETGNLMGLFEALTLSGAEVDVANHEITAFSEGAYEKTITFRVQVSTAAAGATMSFYMLAADYDTTTGRPYLRVGDALIIPKEYVEVDGVAATMDVRYHVLTVGATSTDLCTAKPVDILAEIAVAIPANTTVAVTGGGFAPGTSGRTPRNAGWYDHTFKTAIKKASFKIQGGQQATERYYEKLIGGGQGMFTKATMEADFDLNSQVNDEIWLGEEYTNTAITQTDSDSITHVPYGTKGVFHHLDEDGMRLVYDGTPNIFDCDQIKNALLSQGVTDVRVNGYFGPTLYKYMENAALDFIKEYSGGTDLMSALGQVGVAVRAINKNGILLSMNEMKSFANPVKLGLSSYDFSETGIILPETNVVVGSNSNGEGAKKMKNLVLGYRNYNGENRRRIMKFITGMSGLGIGGNQAASAYDELKGEMLTEFMVMFFKVNQGILMQKAA